jgi:hypothetical protein
VFVHCPRCSYCGADRRCRAACDVEFHLTDTEPPTRTGGNGQPGRRLRDTPQGTSNEEAHDQGAERVDETVKVARCVAGCCWGIGRPPVWSPPSVGLSAALSKFVTSDQVNEAYAKLLEEQELLTVSPQVHKVTRGPSLFCINLNSCLTLTSRLPRSERRRSCTPAPDLTAVTSSVYEAL